jgi:hypothetical protein
MTHILAERSAEKRREGEALIREADNLACQSWNERMSFVTDYQLAKHFDAMQVSCGRRRRMVSSAASFSRRQV